AGRQVVHAHAKSRGAKLRAEPGCSCEIARRFSTVGRNVCWPVEEVEGFHGAIITSRSPGGPPRVAHLPVSSQRAIASSPLRAHDDAARRWRTRWPCKTCPVI